MEFEWDDIKAQANFDKHGIRFEEAAQIFNKPVLTAIDEREDYGEVREISIGRLRGQTVLAVVHTDRDGTTRLISARRATRAERRRFDDHDQEID